MKKISLTNNSELGKRNAHASEQASQTPSVPRGTLDTPETLTIQEWRRAACNRMRVIHPTSGTAGNLVSAGYGFATLFIGYERHGGIQCPRYIKFPLHEIQPEAPLKQDDQY